MPHHPEVAYIGITFLVTVFLMTCLFGHLNKK